MAEIDPALADTAQFCEAYGITPEESANCVVIAAKRGGDVTYAACMITATTRADVNGLVRRHLGARKASFGPVDAITALTGMEYGGITPVGPAGGLARPRRRPGREGAERGDRLGHPRLQALAARQPCSPSCRTRRSCPASASRPG